MRQSPTVTPALPTRLPKGGIAAATFVLASLSASGLAHAAFTDLKFSQYQVADSQWNVGNCTTTDTCEIYSKNPGTAYRIPASSGTITWQDGQYIAFVPNTGTDSATYPLVMTLFDANDNVVETLGTGRVLTAGTDAAGNSYFFFIGNDEITGQLFSGSVGMDSNDGLTLNGTLNPTLQQLNTFSANLSTVPLGAGEIFVPPAGDSPVPTLFSQVSTLERVLAQIDGATNLAQINGTFVNIAENTGVGGINGSILNTVSGITAAARSATADAIAIEYAIPVLNWGDMSTTVLGAVNTGEISLGLNAKVEDARTRSTEAVRVGLVQLGGSGGTGVLVINMASNMSGVDGRIANAMTSVSGTIGNLSTTTLGAVNTGSIVSGVNGTVQGIVELGS